MADELHTGDQAAIAALRQSHIGRLLLNAQRSYSLQALRKLRERGHAGLGLEHTNLIAQLDLHGTRMTTLAERLAVTKQAIGKVVGELEAKGYVRREVDPADRRAAVISFTAEGWRFLQDAHEVKQEIEAEYTAVLGAQDMLVLRQLLARLVRGDAGA